MRHSRSSSSCDCYDSHSQSHGKPREKNLYQVMKSECDLSTLTTAVDSASPFIKEALELAPALTLFAPTNRAFDNAKPCASITGSDLEKLDKTLLYHVVAAAVPSKDLVNDTLVDTLLEKPVRINVYSEPKFRDLITVNGAVVVEADLKASNGYLHKISQVLCPPQKNLLQVLQANDDLSVLVDLLVLAGLDEAVASLPAGTIFAPTNEAFVKLAKYLEKHSIGLENLVADQEALAKVLLYHVLDNTVFSVAIKKGLTRKIPTLLAKKKLDLIKKLKYDDCRHKKQKLLLVEDDFCRKAKVVKANMLATNGVVHKIAQVLLPDICYPCC